jgi:hypothetical protein
MYVLCAARMFLAVRWRVPSVEADHDSGWRQDVDAYDAVDLPHEDFNYAKFIQEEFGSAPKPVGVKTIWWISAIVLIVVFIVIYFYTAH